MRNFSFSLQKVLDLKEKEKELAEWAFGKSMQRTAEEEAKLQQLTGYREQVNQSIVAMQQQTCSAAQLMEVARYRQAIDRAIVSQTHVLTDCKIELQRTRQKLTVRMQEAKLWNRLSDKAKEKFIHEEKQREQKELDEMGTTRYFLATRNR